jgi:hypothetical protein
MDLFVGIAVAPDADPVDGQTALAWVEGDLDLPEVLGCFLVVDLSDMTDEAGTLGDVVLPIQEEDRVR